MNICIIGDGLTSLSLAKNLVNKKINIHFYHKNKVKNSPSSRTIGISKNNLEFFKKEICKTPKKIFWEIKKIEIYSEKLVNENLLEFESDKNCLFYMVKNDKLYLTLINELSKNKYFKKKISNNKGLSSIKDYELIINCDYFNHVTKRYFNKKIEKEYNSIAYTTIIKHEKFLNDSAMQIFTKKGPLAFLPISNFETSVVYSVHDSANICKKDIEELIQIYNFKYKIKKIQKIHYFKLKSLNLRSYYHDNILAFGDLLHRIHPLAGQGFNMTVRDIKTLTNIIKNKYDLGLPLDSSVNSEFENISKYKNFLFSNGIDLIHEFFNLERKINNNILSKSVQFLSKNSSLNKLFTKIADKGIVF